MTIQDAAWIQAWLEPRADEMAELLMNLVAVDTENPPGRALRPCAELLREAMERLNLEPEVIKVPYSGDLEDSWIVRGTVGDGATLLYFHGHFDVVPAQDRKQFSPERHDGKVFGRGTADMKGGLVSMLYGASAAKACGLLGNGRIVLHLVCDEETGSTAGSGYLRQSGMIDPAALAMVTPEPSGGTIWNACRGAITLRIEAHGREAHVGQAHLGVNAFQHMVHIATALEPYAREMMERHTRLAMDGDAARGSMILTGGMCGGGASFNVVPGSSWFTIDGRYNPEEDIKVEHARLRHIIKGAADEIGANVTVDVMQFQPPAKSEQSDAAGATLSACINAVEGAPPRFAMCSGILETRWYAQLGIPAYAYGAGLLDVSHGPNEHIDEGAMRRCAATYALYASTMLA